MAFYSCSTHENARPAKAGPRGWRNCNRRAFHIMMQTTMDESPLAEPVRKCASPIADAQRAVLTLLFNNHRGELFRYLLRLVRSKEDASDLVQETYLRAMRQPPVAPLEGFSRAYLFQIATNLARDHYRRQRFRAHEPLEELPTTAQPHAAGSPVDSAHWEQAIQSLAEALRVMPDPTRQVFLRARIDNRSHAEIARELGISVRTVERRLSEALGSLATRLEGLL